MQNSCLSNVREGSISRKFGEIPVERHWQKTAKASKIYNITVTGKMRCFCHTWPRSSFTYLVSSIDSLRNGSARVLLLLYKSNSKQKESWCANPLLIRLKPLLKAEFLLRTGYWSLNCNSWKSYYSACCGKVSTQQDKLNSAEYILYSVGLPSPLKS